MLKTQPNPTRLFLVKELPKVYVKHVFLYQPIALRLYTYYKKKRPLSPVFSYITACCFIFPIPNTSFAFYLLRLPLFHKSLNLENMTAGNNAYRTITGGTILQNNFLSQWLQITVNISGGSWSKPFLNINKTLMAHKESITLLLPSTIANKIT